MRELSLHILDLAQNSIQAGATLITVMVEVSPSQNLLSFSIEDNGAGMSPEFLEQVTDPFVTTRTTRKVGMGISLTKSGCESCGGRFTIRSKPGEGTYLKATYQLDHIDRQPLGVMDETISNLVMLRPDIDFVYAFHVEDASFVFDTREIKQTLDGAPIEDIDVILFIKEYLAENMKNLSGGINL